jgi:serine/threonine protein kinase
MPGELTDLALSRTFKLENGSATPMDINGIAPGPLLDNGKQDGWLALGSLIDSKYQVIKLLGAGGMGAVYKVKHIKLNRLEALKTFRDQHISMEVWQRFQREAQAIAKLDCLQIVPVYDFGLGPKNVPFYTMQLLDGESLADRIRDHGPLKPSLALDYFEEVARGLLHAHNMEIVHRDIKPGNIFICRALGDKKENVKLVDFGLAKLVTANEPQNQGLTSVGIVFGSPLYMSPEQSLGYAVDERSDQYSYGCALYEALTGLPPMIGKNALATMQMHQSKKPPSLSDGLPQGYFGDKLESLIARLLEKHPNNRYPSFAEIIEALMAIRQQLPDYQEAAPLAVALSERAYGAGATFPPGTELTGGHTSRGYKLPARTSVAIVALVALFLIWPAYFIFQLTRPAPPPVTKTGDTASFTGSLFPPVPGENDVAEPSPKVDLAALPQYFSTIKADHSRQFSFPPGLMLGRLSLSLPGKVDLDCNATGNVTVPPNAAVHLFAGKALFEHPELFRHFREDDLNSLKFGPEHNWNKLHFDEIQRFKRLHRIIMVSVSPDRSFFDDLNHFPLLDVIEVPGCTINGQELLRFKGLLQIGELNADNVVGISPVLEALVPSNQLTQLSLMACNLTDHDMQTIGSIKSLARLRICRNDSISAGGLAALQQLPHLQRLDMRELKVGPECIAVLAKLSSLRQLDVTTAGWNAAQKSALIQSLPHCRALNDTSKEFLN